MAGDNFSRSGYLESFNHELFQSYFKRFISTDIPLLALQYEYGLKSRPQYAKDAIEIDEKDLPTDPPDGRVEYIKKDLGAPAADGEAEPGDNEPEKEGGEDGGSGK